MTRTATRRNGVSRRQKGSRHELAGFSLSRKAASAIFGLGIALCVACAWFPGAGSFEGLAGDIPVLRNFVRPWPECPKERARDILGAVVRARASCDAVFASPGSARSMGVKGRNACRRLAAVSDGPLAWFAAYYGADFVPEPKTLVVPRKARDETLRKRLGTISPSVADNAAALVICVERKGECRDPGNAVASAANTWSIVNGILKDARNVRAKNRPE